MIVTSVHKVGLGQPKIFNNKIKQAFWSVFTFYRVFNCFALQWMYCLCGIPSIITDCASCKFCIAANKLFLEYWTFGIFKNKINKLYNIIRLVLWVIENKTLLLLKIRVGHLFFTKECYVLSVLFRSFPFFINPNPCGQGP